MCPKYKFKIGDIISNGNVEYRVDNNGFLFRIFN